jgi:hypothetical protein
MWYKALHRSHFGDGDDWGSEFRRWAASLATEALYFGDASVSVSQKMSAEAFVESGVQSVMSP